MESARRFASQKLTEHLFEVATVGSLVVLALWLIGNEFARSRARITGLRGPKGWPVIGNYLDIRSNAAIQYQAWGEKYGDVYQVQLGNTTVVIVNSPTAAKTLFMSNSQALSSRPVTYTFHKVASTTAGLTIGSSPYDDSLKRKKKGIAAALNRPAVQTYVPYFDLESKTFIKDLMSFGKAGTVAIDPLPMIQRLSMSLVMTINWGVRVPSIDDELFKEIVEVEEELNRARSTVGNAQDHIPLLRINPFNATSAKARAMRVRRDRYLAKLNRDLAEKMEKGTNKPCIQASVIKFKEVQLDDTELTAISLSVLGGGFETVSNTMQWSIAFLSQNPEIQDKAYEEICKFQGSDEPLCDASDDQKCGYILGLAKEALRYFSVIPLALPRASIKDIEYEGVRIPAGSTVYMNAWACNRDPELFPDPERFAPERWFERPDAPIFAFGLGYRMCAGHLLALRELYLIFMRLLSSFRIETAEKIPCDPSKDMKIPTDLIMAPRSYRVSFKPRNKQKLVESLARSSVKAE
ncbi:putative cytochrome P450 phenylacetate hydroxylase [Xylariaceae sp. FL1651]|nr:putative cytochrome P450 phenylacetate hydroxylase [Xylariaceae sp. FL1651]